jgi:hypothetical protein
LAIVTTNAMPAAAGAPVRNRVGMEKNGPYAEQWPIGTSVSDKTARTGSRKRAQPKKPAPMIDNGSNMEWPLVATIGMRAVQHHANNRHRANRSEDYAYAEIADRCERFDNQRRPKRVSVETNCSQKKDNPKLPDRRIGQCCQDSN